MNVRREVVLRGFSGQLSQLADFFALHNRQGASEQDWFAGADIFILSRYEQTLFIEPCSISIRPALENAWELLSAAYGAPLKTLTIDIVKQLAELGYDPKALQKEASIKSASIPVAVFARGGDCPSLIFCTDGLRNLATGSVENQPRRAGNELVFQLAIAKKSDSDSSASIVPADSEIPDWPLRVLTIGWILMQSAKSKTIKSGAGLACDAPLIVNADTELRSIFATVFSPIKSEQLCVDGPFNYINLVGITSDEAKVAAKYSAEFLLRLLEHKELHQLTKPNRSSIVARTGLLEEAAKAKPPAATTQVYCGTEYLPQA